MPWGRHGRSRNLRCSGRSLNRSGFLRGNPCSAIISVAAMAAVPAHLSAASTGTCTRINRETTGIPRGFAVFSSATGTGFRSKSSAYTHRIRQIDGAGGYRAPSRSTIAIYLERYTRRLPARSKAAPREHTTRSGRTLNPSEIVKGSTMAKTDIPAPEHHWEALRIHLRPFPPDEQRAAVALYRELAKGRAVDAAQLAQALGVSPAE